MKAIILAAGRGSRMGGLTDTQPKGLVSLRGKPLLEWQLASLRAAGIHEIALVTGYRHEALSPYGLPMFHNPDWRRTNMVTSLACAREWLQAEACIVSYSDIFYEANAVRKLMDSDAALALTYDPDWLRLWRRALIARCRTLKRSACPMAAGCWKLAASLQAWKKSKANTWDYYDSRPPVGPCLSACGPAWTILSAIHCI